MFWHLIGTNLFGQPCHLLQIGERLLCLVLVDPADSKADVYENVITYLCLRNEFQRSFADDASKLNTRLPQTCSVFNRDNFPGNRETHAQGSVTISECIGGN